MSQRLQRATLFLLVLGCSPGLFAQNDASAQAASPASATPPVAVLTVPVGERLVLELEETLNTRSNQSGDRVQFNTYREVVVGTQVVIPPGSLVRATLLEVRKPGRAGRAGQMRLRFDEVTLPDGTTLPFEANLVRAGFILLDKQKDGVSVKGENGTSKRDVLTVALGAGQGALIGASVGGKKGAAYGGAIGAGIGLIEILLRKGPDLDLPRGMFFEVELSRALGVPLASAARFTQLARTAAPRPPDQSVSADFSFPEEAGLPAEEPIPDFPEEESGPSASAHPPAQAPGAPAELPPPTAPPSPEPALEAPADFTLKVDVRLVMVDAVARDNRGRVLEDLKREDFKLYEDGVEQTIRHFSRDELPLAVALVVDRSGSVAPFMAELRRAAYQTLSQLKPGDQVALFSFATDVERLEELTTDRRRIAERIARIEASGGTNITDALAAATQYLALAAPERRRAVILISDNQETVRGQASQGRLVRLALESEVVIYSVKTPGESTPLTMRVPVWMSGLSSVRVITRDTGGEIIDVERVGSLEAALATVVSRLKTRYTLGYQSSNKAADGSFRRIVVVLAERFGRPGSDYSIYARRGYYAPTERVASQPASPRN